MNANHSNFLHSYFTKVNFSDGNLNHSTFDQSIFNSLIAHKENVNWANFIAATIKTASF